MRSMALASRGPTHADLGNRPLPVLEVPDPLSGQALPGGHFRSARKRRSDRPGDYDAYRRREFAADAVAVLDAAGIDRAIVVNWCDMGESLILAAEHPERVASLVFIAPPLSEREQERGVYPFDAELDTDEGWAKETRSYWLRDWPGYLEFFFAMCLTNRIRPNQSKTAWAGRWTPTWRRSWPGSAVGRPRSSGRGSVRAGPAGPLPRSRYPRRRLGHARRGYRGVPGGEAPSSGIANGGGDGPKD
jgi:pimeloyl-ACP methyl ester carboxylesterase